MRATKSVRQNILINNVITILIPVIFFGFFAIQFNMTRYEEDVIIKNSIIANTLAEQFETLQREPIEIAGYVEDEFIGYLDGGIDDINHSLFNLVGNYGYLLNIEVVDDQGIVIKSALDEDDVGSNRSGEEFFGYFQTDVQDIYWTTPYMSTTIDQLTYSLNYKSEKGFYIVLYVSLQSLSEASQRFSADFDEDVQVAIVDEVGKYISYADITKVHYRMLDDNIETIRAAANGKITHGVVPYEGVQQVLTAVTMNDGNWYVVVYQPSDSVFALLRELITMLIVIIFIATAISIVYTLRYSGKINDLIIKLQDSMEEAIGNNYRVEMMDYRYDDLNSVASKFKVLMSEVRERDSKLNVMAFNDSLTGIGNRSRMTEAIKKAANVSYDSPLTMLQIDIDGFKMINDIYGHDVGDDLLIYIANTFQSIFEGMNPVVCRIGADEFGVLLPELLDEEAALELFRPLKGILSKGVYIAGRLIRAGITVGMAYYPEHTRNDRTLIQYADIALVEAKSGKRGSLKVFDSSMKEKIHERSNMEHLLRNALETQMYELHFQPQISVESNQIFGFEALVRLRNNDDELIAPNKFIPIAEATGLIIEIGEWILEEAIHRLLMINEQYSKSYRMAVNISTVQMREPGFADTVLAIIEKTGVDRELLEFEITESLFIHAESEAFQTLETLHGSGIRFSLDDFGTGYSSLSYLTNMPFSILKIDRSFIADVEKSDAKRNMLESIVSMGHKLDKVIVAEGVETMEQLHICNEYGCDIIQGYLYSRPLSYKNLLAYIDRENKKK